MYHITKDGPKECKATVRNCPFAGEDHHESLREAEKAFASSFNFNSQRKVYAPPRSDIQPTSPEVARSILEEAREQNPETLWLEGSTLLAHSQFGSIVYGLDHTTSDNDLILLVDAKADKDLHYTDSQDRDVRIASVYNFANEYAIGAAFAVDVAHSDVFDKSYDQRWIPYLENLRFNHYQYVANLRKLSVSFAATADRRRNESRQVLKLIKTSLRNEILANRFEREGRVRPGFTADEREAFYRSLKTVNRDFLTAPDIYELIQKASREVS
jgi:hypothetical protein